jgi:hypothetical protein
MHALGPPQGQIQQSRAVLFDSIVVALVLLAPALGGATRLWQQAFLLLGTGLVILLNSHASLSSSSFRRGKEKESLETRAPLSSPSIWENVKAQTWIWPPTLLILVCATFLPATWFGIPSWRKALTQDYQLALPDTFSPQPWLTLENSLLLAGGIVWATWLCSRRWTLRRSTLLSLYCAGLLALVAVNLVLYLCGGTFDLWQPQGGGFGFFPNRNQTGNLVAIGAICMLALAFHAFRRHQKIGVVWVLGYAISLVALIVNFSRAGLLSFFLGSVAWVFWATLSGQRKRGLGLGLSLVLLLLTVFFLFGGRTLERFVGGADRPPDDVVGRLFIHADALRLLKEVSWHGIGLGNFPPIFAHYRQASAAGNRAIHPESDWLWMGAELGWFAPLLIFVPVGLWLWKFWPSRSGTNFYLAAAITVGTLAFIAHGFIDVSAHRMGTAWPMLFLLSLLRDPGREPAPHFWPAPVWYASALVLIAISAAWLSAACGVKTFPNSATLDRLRADLARSQRTRSYDYTVYLANTGLRFVPLDWELYFYRALARAEISTNMDEAAFDFARARFLEPNMVEVPFEEGRAWLRRDAKQAVVPWNEALRRAGTNSTPVYANMLRTASNHPEIRNDLRAFALDDPPLLLEFLRQATSEEILIEVERVLDEDASLRQFTPAQRHEFLSIWAQRGNQKALLEKFEGNPEWVNTGWSAYAEVLGATGQFQKACEVAARFASAPALPQAGDAKSMPQLQRDLLISTNDYVAGFALYQAHRSANAPVDALEVLRKLTPQSGCPLYFWYLRAQLEMEQGKWENAWLAWSKYLKL